MKYIKVKSIPEQITNHFKMEIITKVDSIDKLSSFETLARTLQVTKSTIAETLEKL